MIAQQTAPDLRLAEALGTRITRINTLLRQAILSSGPSLAQARTMATLRDSGPRRVTDLAELEQVAQPTMSALIARLERERWVERHGDDGDRRAVLVRLTPTGRAVLGEITALRTRALGAHLESLAESERAALEAVIPVLDKIIQHAQSKEVASS